MTIGKQRNRPAFTLLELVLVLAIIAVVAALASPNVIQAFRRQTLKNSGDAIRAEWAKARTRAMTSGRVQIFRCSMGGNQYRTDTWVSASDAFGVTGQASAAAPQQIGLDATSSQDFRELPNGVSFYASDTVSESRELATDAEVGGVAGSMYERRIYFYPDGTCTTGQVVLINDRQQFVVVELRGLTGASRVSEVKTQDEVIQQ